jgi:hypothetical protein
VLDATPAVHAALVADGREGTVADGTGSRHRCGHRSNSCVKLKSPAARRFGIGASVSGSASKTLAGTTDNSHARARQRFRFVMRERA